MDTSTHRTSAVLFALLLLSPGMFDHLLTTVSASFSAAQQTVRRSPLDDGTKNQLSNVLKTRHDTVKNSINNVR